MRLAALALAFAILPQAAPLPKKELDRRIEELFSKLLAEKDEAARGAARAELEAIGRPILPVLKKYLDEEVARAKKAKEKAETIVDRYVPRLDDDAIESRESAMLALIDQGEAILPGLKKHERSSSAEIRARVAQIAAAIEARRTGGRTRVAGDALLLFSRVSDPSGAATVAGFFEGRDAELRLQAAKSFHEIALPADLPKLKPLLADADLKVRAQACVAAADLGHDAAVPMLFELVKSEKDLNVWRAAVYSMARWRALWPPEISAKFGELIPGAAPDRRPLLVSTYFRAGKLPDPPEALLKVFRTLAPAEKAELLKPWSGVEDPSWVAAAKTLAADPDPSIAGPAAVLYGYARFFRFSYPVSFLDRYDSLPADERLFGIRALALQDQVRTAHAIPLLLRETEPVLRKALIEAGFENPTFVTGGVLRQALLSGQPDLVRAAAACYHHNGIHESLPAVKYLFLTTKDPILRARLGLAVASEGDLRGIPHLAPFLKDPSPRLRATAAEAVGMTQAADLLDGLVPLLKDPEALVRNAAAEALLRSGQAKYLDPLRSERGLESFAARAIGKYGTAADLEKLLQQNPAARPYAPTALLLLSPLEPHPLLEPLAKDKDSQVRSNAERALAHVKIAALLPQQIVDAAAGKGAFPQGDPGFGYASDFVFVTAAECTAKVAAEKRAIPIPLKEFLAAADVGDRQFFAATIFRRAAPGRCPKELLDLLTEGHPRLDAALRLLRSRPYPEAAPLLAALPPGPELVRILSWCDPLVLHGRLLEGIEKGTIADGPAGLAKLSEFIPEDEYVSLLLRLSQHPAPGVKGVADQAIAFRSPRALCAMLADGRITDRALVLRSLVRMKVPGTLPTIEQSLKEKDPAIRALAAVALVTAKEEEALPAAIPCLAEATGDVAWELAAKIIVYLKESHRPLLPAESPSAAVHALLARLGRKESAAKVLAEFPPTNAGKMAAGLALAAHYDAAVEAKLAPLLAGQGLGWADRDGALGLGAALGRSTDPATRARVLDASKGISLLGKRIHPATLDALEGLVLRGEPAAAERVAMARGIGMPEAKEDAIALLLRIGTDEAAAFLVDFLNVPATEIPASAPKVLECIQAHAKDPKTGEKLRQVLAKPTFHDFGLLVPLFAEAGATAEFEQVLEQKAKGSENYGPSLGALQLLARTPTGMERLKKLAKEMGASKDARLRSYGAFAAILSGTAPPPEEWRVHLLRGGGSEATLVAGQLRLVETVGSMLRRAREGLSGTHDAGMAAALPLLTCQDLRPPESSRADYWPAMSKFLSELDGWVKKNRGRTFEEVFADALKARGLPVAGKAVGPADAATLVAALDDKDDFIAANADWMLRRISGPPAPPALSFVGDAGLPYELRSKYGPYLVTVTLGAGRWHVRRPSADEVAAWKKLKK